MAKLSTFYVVDAYTDKTASFFGHDDERYGIEGTHEKVSMCHLVFHATETSLLSDANGITEIFKARVMIEAQHLTGKQK